MTKSTRRILKTVCLGDATIDTASIDHALRVLDGERAVTGTETLPALLSQSEKARQLGVSRFTVRKLVEAGKLHPIELLPGLLRYPAAELVEEG